MRALRSALSALLLAGLPAGAAVLLSPALEGAWAPERASAADDTYTALKDSLRDGVWTERVRAVNQLGGMGEPGAAALRPALRDPDWQVRFAAVYWLGRRGAASREALEGLLEGESCPLVRMSAHHWLARSRREAGPVPEAGPGDSPAACESWFWPVSRENLALRRRSANAVVATPPDARGCVYVRYGRMGRAACPAKTTLKGVGPSPGRAELLEESPPDSGVALCCPADKVLDQPPSAEEAECRLVPEECPPGWAELTPEEALGTDRRKLGFKRSRQAKEGDLTWLNCCRKSAPKREEPPEPAAPAAPRWAEPDRTERIAGLPFGKTFALEKAPAEPAPAPQPAPRDGARKLELPAGVESLLAPLRSGGARERERSALALARLGPEASGAAGALVSTLREDSSPRVRACAALALAAITRGTDAAVPALKRALSDRHAGVRYSAAQALGVVGTPAAQKAFLGAARDEAVELIRKGG